MAANYQRPEVLAQLFGVTTRRIQQLTQDGVLTSEKVPGEAGRRYDLVPNIKFYIQYLQERLKKTGSTESQQENLNAKLAAEVRIKSARAEVAEMELKELRGKLYRAEDIEKLTNELVYSVRALLLSLPSRLCIDVAAINTPAEVNQYITGVISGCLQDLAKHEFSSDRYLELIKQREGLVPEDEEEQEEDAENEEI